MFFISGWHLWVNLIPTGYPKTSDSDSLDSWALLLRDLWIFLTKRAFHLCSRNDSVTKRVFSLCLRNECSQNDFFGLLTKRVVTKRLFTPAHESTIHETSAHETSFKLNRKSTILDQKFNKLNFSFEFIHETSFSLCSLNECWQNEFFALLTKQVLMKRVLTSAHETSLKLVTKFTI